MNKNDKFLTIANSVSRGENPPKFKSNNSESETKTSDGLTRLNEGCDRSQGIVHTGFTLHNDSKDGK